MGNRKTAAPLPEPGVFAPDAPAVVARVSSQAEFFARQQHTVQRARHGDLVEAAATVTFESADAFLAVLTPKRYELVKIVKQQGPFESIEALAAAVHRNRASVSRDLKALAVAGLIRMRD